MEKKETAPRLRLETLDVRKLKLVFFWVFALGLTAHGYRFMNPNFNHDSLYSLYEQGPELMISVGRFLRPVYRLRFPCFQRLSAQTPSTASRNDRQ